MTRALYYSLFAIFLVGCGNVPTSTIQPITPEPTIQTSIKTPEIATHSTSDADDGYTQEPHSRVQNCVEFRDVYDFTREGECISHDLGTRKVRECIDFLLELEPPMDCLECQQLIPLVEGFANQTLASMDLIELGFESQKEAFISEGLITFWDGDMIWEAIRLSINQIRIGYKLSEIE